MAKSEWKTRWLLLSNKILSGLLALIGFAPHSDEDEVSTIVPMYGMPSSVYKTRQKAQGNTAARPVATQPTTYLLITEKEKKHAV